MKLKHVATAAVLAIGSAAAWSASFLPGDIRIDPRDVRICARDGCVAGGMNGTLQSPTLKGATMDSATVGGPVDSTHPGATGGTSANNLGTTPGTVDCLTSTQNSTSMLCIRGRTDTTPRNNFMVNLNLDVYPGLTGDPTPMYAGVRIHPGGRQAWAGNLLAHIEPGGLGGLGLEIDLNNWNCDAGDNGVGAAPGCGMSTPIGLLVSGSGPYTAGPAIAISGVSSTNPQWHRGIEMLGGSIIDQASIYTDNSAANDYVMRGYHQGSGLEMSYGTFLSAAIHMRYGQNQLWTGDAGIRNLFADANGFHFDQPGGSVTITPDGGVTAGANFRLGDGKFVCWDGSDGACVTYQASSHKFIFATMGSDGSFQAAASINGQNGNIVTKGTITQGGTP